MESATGVTSRESPPFDERPPASLSKRAAARLLDALTVFFVLWALAVMQILWPVNQLAREMHPDPWGAAFIPTMVFTLCVFAHEAYFTVANHGQTPGMDACRVRVVTVDGAPLGARRCIVRSAPVAVLWLVPPLWLGGLLVAATGLPAFASRSRASVSDRLAGTRVVPYDRTREDPDGAGASGPVMRRNFRRALDAGRASRRSTSTERTPT